VTYSLFSLPLVARELRSQSRSKGSFILRSLLALGLLAPMALMGLTDQLKHLDGRVFFWFLSHVVFYSLMLLGPLITAGCITAEKEEGTLGLLFLSPLRSFDIVAGKFTANFLRLVAIAVVGMPVLATTLLLGGVTWQQITGAGICIMALLVVTVGVTVLASAVCVKTRTATGLAFAYIGLVNFGIWILALWIEYKFKVKVPDLILLVSAADSMSEQFTWTRQNYLAWAGWTLAVGCAQSLLFLLIASWWLPRTLASTGVEGRWKWRRFLQKRFTFENAWNQRLRRRNPLLWLEARQISLTGRILIASMGVGGLLWWVDYKNIGREAIWVTLAFAIPIHILLSALTVGNICREVAGELHMGHLQLLLCTPLRERDILRSKLKGAWLRYGTLYLAATVPTVLSLVIWLPDYRQNQDFEVWLLMECFEDVTYFFMIFSVAFRMALFSQTATNAILKTIGWIAGGLILWLSFTLIGLNNPRYLDPLIDNLPTVIFLPAIVCTAVCIYTILFARSATHRALKSFIWFMLGLFFWWGAGADLNTSGLSYGLRKEVWIRGSATVKIIIESVVVVWLMKSLPGQLRERCVIRAGVQ